MVQNQVRQEVAEGLVGYKLIRYICESKSKRAGNVNNSSVARFFCPHTEQRTYICVGENRNFRKISRSPKKERPFHNARPFRTKTLLEQSN